MFGITDLKVGAKIKLDNIPYTVLWSQHAKQARGAGVMKTKLKNLLTGNNIERTFQGADKIDEADIGFSRAQFLYRSGDSFEFMDQTSFDTVTFDKEKIGDSVNFLLDGMDIDIQYFDNKAINIQLPPKMTFEVVRTDPGVKGDTATGGSKPAEIQTGYIVKVPLFVNAGDKIVINTDTGEYCERAK
jgi:elongation factor P